MGSQGQRVGKETYRTNLSNMDPLRKILSLYSIFLVLHFALGGPYATVCKRDSQLYKKCLKIQQRLALQSSALSSSLTLGTLRSTTWTVSGIASPIPTPVTLAFVQDSRGSTGKCVTEGSSK